MGTNDKRGALYKRGLLARQIGGIWGKRKDIKDIDSFVRKLRKGKRLKSLGLGGDSARF